MRSRILFLSTLFSVPLLAFALDFSGDNLPYSDVSSGTPEAAAISLLTTENVLEGYPDGSFRPERTLNRAEFLKIVIESNPDVHASEGEAEHCFPDVFPEEWFSTYVCLAKRLSIVSGYPDGTFKPAGNVNYAEALKMLANLYGYPYAPEQNDAWYAPYYRSADERGVTLPVGTAFDAFLTRGQMARLAAAFLAEDRGVLAEYRLAERGLWSSSSSSSSSSTSASSSSSSSSTSSSSSSSSSSSALSFLPARSTFMIVGSLTKPLADGIIESEGEDEEIRYVRVKLDQEVRTVDFMELLTEDGTLIASLPQRTTTDIGEWEQTYEAYLPAGEGFVLPADTPVHVYARAKIRDLGNNGASNQLLQVRDILVSSFGMTSGDTDSHPLLGPFPKHQSAFGRITSVRSVGEAEGALAIGTGQTLARFAFDAEALSGKNVTLRQLTLTAEKEGSISLSSIRVMNGETGESSPCTMGTSGINCLSLPASLGRIDGSLTLSIVADVSSASSDAVLRLVLHETGSPSSLGSVHWTDGTGEFRWVESEEPVARGTVWRR